jgi:hypothetical protein
MRGAVAILVHTQRTETNHQQKSTQKEPSWCGGVLTAKAFFKTLPREANCGDKNWFAPLEMTVNNESAIFLSLK